MPKEIFILTEDLHVQDPHEVFMGLFESSNSEPILLGTIKEFIKKSIYMILFLMGLRLLFENYLPGIIEAILAVIIGIISVIFVTYSVKYIIPAFFNRRVRTGAKLFTVLSLFIMIGVIFGVG